MNNNLPYQKLNRPITAAQIMWGPSPADPAHLIWAAFPNGVMFGGTRWQRLLIKLLGKSLTKQYEKDMEILRGGN